MPPLFVPVEAQRLGKLGIPLLDVAGYLVRLAEARLFRPKSGVEERDGRLLLFRAVPDDRL